MEDEESPDPARVRAVQNEFLEQVMDRLLRYALYRENNQYEAEDLSQEALIRVLKAWDWTSEQLPSLAYAKAALRTAMCDSWRKKDRRPGEVSAGDGLENIPAPRTGQEEIVNSDLSDAVKSLPPRHRRLIEGVYFEGLSLQEFAVRERLATGTVYNYHQQALDQLSQKLTSGLVRS